MQQPSSRGKGKCKGKSNCEAKANAKARTKQRLTKAIAKGGTDTKRKQTQLPGCAELLAAASKRKHVPSISMPKLSINMH